MLNWIESDNSIEHLIYRFTPIERCVKSMDCYWAYTLFAGKSRLFFVFILLQSYQSLTMQKRVKCWTMNTENCTSLQSTYIVNVIGISLWELCIFAANWVENTHIVWLSWRQFGEYSRPVWTILTFIHWNKVVCANICIWLNP